MPPNWKGLVISSQFDSSLFDGDGLWFSGNAPALRRLLGGSTLCGRDDTTIEIEVAKTPRPASGYTALSTPVLRGGEIDDGGK